MIKVFGFNGTVEKFPDNTPEYRMGKKGLWKAFMTSFNEQLYAHIQTLPLEGDFANDNVNELGELRLFDLDLTNPVMQKYWFRVHSNGMNKIYNIQGGMLSESPTLPPVPYDADMWDRLSRD